MARSSKQARGRVGATASRPRRRRRGRKLVAALGVVVVVLIAGVWLLGPIIAGPIVGELIEKAVNDRIAGSVRVSGVSLSWTGEQRVESIVLRDPQGSVVGELELSLGRGVIALVRGSRDLGDCSLTGHIDLIRHGDGSTNLQRAIKILRPGQPSKGPASLPAGFALGLEIERLAISLTDQSAPGQTTHVLIDARVSATVGKAMALQLNATITAPGRDGGADQTGSLTLVGEVRDWTARDGRLTLDDPGVSATLTGSGLPIAVADRLGGFEGRLIEALGDRLEWTASLEGTREDAMISATASAPHAHGAVSVRVAPGLVELTEPAEVVLIEGRAVALVPVLAERFEAAGRSITLDAAPTVTLRVEHLRATFDPHTGALNSIRGEAVASVGAMAGTITTKATDGVTQETRHFAIEPILARVQMDETGLAHLTTSTTAALDDLSAGTLRADLSATDLLADRAFDWRAISGTIELAGLDTRLIEPFAAGTGVRVASDIGPTLDGLIALTPGEDGTRVEVSIDAELVQGRASLLLGDDRLTTRDDGITLAAQRGGTMLAALIERAGNGTGDAEIATGGPGLRRVGMVTLRATSLDMPLGGDSLRAVIEQTRASIEVSAQGLVVRPPAEAHGAYDLKIKNLTLAALLVPNEHPRLTLDATMTQGTQQGTLRGELTMASLASLLDNGATAGGLKLAGSIELTGLSHRLAGWVPVSIETTAGGPLDLQALASQAWGPTAHATLVFEHGANASTRAVLHITGRRGRIDAIAEVFDDRIVLESASISGQLGLHAFRTLAESFGPQWNTPPRLREPAAYELRIEPLEIALDGSSGEPTILRTHLTMPATTVIGLSLRQEDGSIFRPGPMTIEDLRVSLMVPLGADHTGNTPPTTMIADLRLADRTGTPVGEIRAELALEAGTDETPGTTRASVHLQGVRTAWVAGVLDSLIEDADLLPDTLGARADVDLTYTKTGDRQTLGVSFDAPLLRTLGVMELAVDPTRLRLTRPVRLQGELMPAVLTRLVLGPQSPVSFDRPTKWTAQINRLDLPRAGPDSVEPRGIRGAMRIEAGLSVPELALNLGNGQHAVYRDLSATIATDPDDTSVVRIAARASRAIADQPATRSLDLDATISGLGDDGFSTANARVSLTATLDKAPTALLDALLNQGGLLADALGPQASATIRVTGLSRTGGTIDATLDSPLAHGRITGRVGEGVIELNEPAVVEISRFGPGLMRRLTAMSPLIGSIEKRPQDGPAVLTISSLRMGTDGDLRKLDATITLDIGTAHFKASDRFAPLLSVVNWQTDTTIGRRIKPLEITIDKGVASTQGFAVPLGEFVFESRGSYDLVTQEIDVVVLIPLGLLSDDVARSIEQSTRQFAGVLGQVGLTMEPVTKIPFRLRGPINSAMPRFDAQLLIDEFLGEQLKPEKIIERGARELLRGLFGDKPKKKDGG